MGVSRSGSFAALTAGALACLWFAAGSLDSWALQRGGSATGSIRGRVLGSGAIATASPLKVTVDERTCGATVPDEAVVLDKEGGVAHAVVVVKGLAWGEAAPVRLTNKGCRFMPHVTVVRPGTTLELTNDDPTLHTTHAYAADGRSLFNVALPVPGLVVKRPADKATGTTRVACDTHPWMQGFVYVSADRAVVSDADGRFAFTDVPPGTYELTIWHERLKGAVQRVTVAAGQSVDAAFTVTPDPDRR